MDILDPQGICRCCLSDRRDTLRSIFDSSIREMYVACTSLQISPNDGLPGSICGMCIFKCISWSSFKQQCERSELMLKIQFNIQSAAEPEAEILEIADDNELATATSMKEECAVLEVREPKDMTIDMVDVVDGSHDFTIDESSEAQIIVEESVDDGPKLDDGYSNSDKTVDEENEEEDMITIVNDTEYLEELSDMEEETAARNAQPTRVSPRNISRTAKSRKLNLSCDKCKETFRSVDRLEAHTRTHLGQKPELCTICNKGFDNPRALYRHRLKHSDEKSFPCPQCNKSYKYQTSLTLHLKIHANGKCFVCDHCGKSFDRVHGLQSHMLSHTTETPFECDQCEKRFKNVVMLRSHQQRHQGVKRFACETCGKLFTTTAELRTHSRMHTGQKPFKCSDCEKAFKTKSHLAVHFRTHSGARPYSCDVCDQTFAHLKVLKHHKMVHTGERPHICTICERPFRQRSTMTAHMRTHRARHEADISADDEET